MGTTFKLLTATLASAMLVAGCTKSSSSGGGGGGVSALSISGNLAIEGSTSSGTTMSVSSLATKMMGIDKFAVSDYRIACATFEDVPKSCGGDVASTGAFSVSCSGFVSIPFGCFVYHKTTYANYPITFNINSGDDQSTLSVNGNLSATINLDLESGTATAAATVAAGTENEIAVDLAKVGNLSGAYLMAGAPFSEVSSKYTAEQLEFFKFIPCMMGHNNSGSPDLTNCTNGSSETGFNAMAAKMSGGLVELNANTDSTGASYLSAWDGGGARAACGNIEEGFAWKVSDGATNSMADVSFDLSGADQTALKAAVGTSIGSIISTYFQFLADGTASSSTFVSSCKYAADLDMDFWNNTPEQVAACQADTTNCYTGFGDAFGALHRYKFKKLWDGYFGTDTVLGAVDYRGKLVSESSALKYGYRSWDATTNQPTIVELEGLTASNIDDKRVDLGGCLQWPNWSDTTSTGPRVATVVPVGDYLTFYGPNGEVNKDKCRMSEKRLLYAATDGHIQVGSTIYKDINVFVDMGGGNFQDSWNKVCQVGVDGADPDSTIDNVSAPTTDIMMYPVDFDSTKIASEAQNRFNGGSQEQRKGIKLDAIYALLTDDSSNMNENFWYWDMATSTGGSLTCTDIKAPTDASATWTKIELAMKNTFDPWSLRGLLACTMIGVANGQYDGNATLPNDNMTNGQVTLPAEYKDLDNNKLPDIVDSLRANSCIPKFQMTSICADDGFCDSRVVCNSMTAANGGCDTAEPAGRFARMKTEAIGGDKFRFFNREERYENYFDPSSNKSQQCTRGEAMTITTEDAVTTALATGQKVRLSFGRTESKICDGESSEVNAMPPIYLDFTKQ